jgi:uncharacterized protein YfdQ (DUF2303 family)
MEDFQGNIPAAIAAGEQLSKVQNVIRDEGCEHTKVIIKEGFRLELIDNDLKRPIRKSGTKEFTSVKSFCSYVNKHKSADETVIIADEDKGQMLAILNDDGKEKPAWADFKAYLKLGHSKQFQTWLCNREKKFNQEDFADFIEDNRTDLMVGTIKIDGAEFKNISPLELKRLILDLKMTMQESLSSKLDPVTGATSLSYVSEEIGKGNVVIPEKFVIAIPIYKTGDIFQVTILLRLRVREDQASFYYFIDQLELLKETAFDEVCKRITKGNLGSEEKEEKQFEGTQIEVFKGTW